MTSVVLTEWETAEPHPGSSLANVFLDSYPKAKRLAEKLTEGNRMEVLELARGLELRATSFVGRFSLGDVLVTVHPKIAGAPLLNLFRYAYGLRNLDLYSAVNFASEKWSFQDLLIQQLATEVDELLSRGIHRDYERKQADLASPRGRIDFIQYVRSAHSARATLPCVHHPRTDDTLLNRVLLAGLNFSAVLATDVELKGHVRRLGKMIGATVAFRPLDAFMLSDAWRTMDRRTTAYEPALTLIELLFSGQGVSLDHGERIRLSGFLFDMNRFFQSLVSRFLHEHLVGVDVRDEFRLKEMFSYKLGENPRGRRAPVLRPDFVLMRGQRVAGVLDAKYRDLWETGLPREMLYQLALYALSQPVNNRAAAILYPTMDSTALEQTIIFHEPIRGASEARVILRPLNLLDLNELLRAGGEPQAVHKRIALARRLAFGSEAGQS